LSVLGARLLEIDGRRPADLEEAVRLDRQNLEMRALVFQAVTSAVTDRLEGSGIPTLPLKGVALARRAHGDEALRLITDIDVLVPADQLVAAVQVAQEMGYVAHGGVEARLPQLHYSLVDPRGALPPLELHWRIHWYETRFARAMLDRAERVGSQRAAQPEDELAALLLYYQRDGFAGLRLACDIAAWWDRNGATVRPGALDDLASEHPELRRAWIAAALTAEEVVGLPGRELLDSAHAGKPHVVRAAVRLANWALVGNENRISTDVTLVDGLCTPRGGFRHFARRALFLDPERIREYYDLTTPNRALERLLWSWHPVKILLRYTASLLRILVRPGTTPIDARIKSSQRSGV
jgi:hypothetical protein